MVEAVQAGRDYSVEYWIVLPDGSIRFIQSVGRGMANEAGEMSAVEGRQRELVVKTQVYAEAELLVTVGDSGIGLDPLSMEQMFMAFHTTKPGGLGMALSISRSIVEAHDGRLWATANDGPGATFQFTLPRHPPDGPLEGRS